MRSTKAPAIVRGARAVALFALLGAATADAQQPAPEPSWRVLQGACYCRAAGELHCTAALTEPECRRRCAEALCDDWFWLERLPCWNWGYGG